MPNYPSNPTWPGDTNYKRFGSYSATPTWPGLGPSVAPILMVEAQTGSYIAELDWTPSNNGAVYDIYMSVDMGPFAFLATTALTSYDTDQSPNDGFYSFRVTPRNSSAEGPSSNVASTDLPGKTM